MCISVVPALCRNHGVQPGERKLPKWNYEICATKVSAGVSTGIGDHEEKYEGKEDADVGDEQFEINDDRSFDKMYQDMEQGGLQPVLNDYIYV